MAKKKATKKKATKKATKKKATKKKQFDSSTLSTKKPQVFLGFCFLRPTNRVRAIYRQNFDKIDNKDKKRTQVFIKLLKVEKSAGTNDCHQIQWS